MYGVLGAVRGYRGVGGVLEDGRSVGTQGPEGV